MTDWVAYGQTNMAASSAIDNPAANLAGVEGEVTLPYTVPAGKRLILTGWGFEGLNSQTNFGVCIPWIGEAPCTNAKCLASVGCNGGSYYVTGMRWVIPAGKKLNVRLINGSPQNNVICAWMIQGILEDVE
jgi:hypothetical protein